MNVVIAFVVAVIVIGGIVISRERARRYALSFALRPFTAEDKTGFKVAVLFSKSGPYTVVDDWPRPRISPKELLIENRAIGLNPIDWKCVAYGFGVHSVPWMSGREAAGIVEEVGSELLGFQKGDRVFVTSTNYRDNRSSTFQEYIAAFPFNVGRLPSWISFEEGAILRVGYVAAAGALFEGLSISRIPIGVLNVSKSTEKIVDGEAPWILIWGGSCVTGMMAAQLAKRNGFRVFAVAGLRNAPHLLELGVDRVVDRHHPENAIAEARKLNIKLGVDCVGQTTATYAVQALQPGGKLAYLVKNPDQSVAEQAKIEVTNILIKRYHEDEAYGQSITDYISHCLARKIIKPFRHRTVNGGFEAIETALVDLRSDLVSGHKLVIRLDTDSQGNSSGQIPVRWRRS